MGAAPDSPLLPRSPSKRHPDTMAESGLSKETVLKFQRLVREDCGVELSLEGAWNRARRFVALYRMLMAPIPEDIEPE